MCDICAIDSFDLLAVNQLLGYADRVALTNRPKHDPTEESNEQIYAFFEHFLQANAAK